MPSVTKSKKIRKNKQKKDIFFIKILHKNSFFCSVFLSQIYFGCRKKMWFCDKIISHIIYEQKDVNL